MGVGLVFAVDRVFLLGWLMICLMKSRLGHCNDSGTERLSAELGAAEEPTTKQTDKALDDQWTFCMILLPCWRQTPTVRACTTECIIIKRM